MERLNDAGFATLSGDQELPDHTQMCDKKELTQSQQISHNHKKIKFIQKTNEEFFDETFKELTETFGKEPTEKFIVSVCPGHDLFVLCVENKVVSPYAFTSDKSTLFRLK